MRYSISIVALNNLDITRRCIELLEVNAGADYELIISDNCSDDGTAEYLKNYSKRNRNCRIITYQDNRGFGFPHNQALELAKGEFFVVLNNDIFIYEAQCLKKMSEYLEANNLAIVGLAGNHSKLLNNGDGVIDPTCIDFVQASCMIMHTSLARTYGLFAQEYELAYFEDADLSLRYRQMGFNIGLIHCEHSHVHRATTSKLDPHLFRRIFETNRTIFLKRWSGYLKTRNFTGKTLIIAQVDNLLHLLQITPVIAELKRQHPVVQFEVVSENQDVFKNNPSVSRCILPYVHLDLSNYDRVIRFDFNGLSQSHSIAIQLAEQAAVQLSSLNPRLYLDELDYNPIAKEFVDSKVVCIDGSFMGETTTDLIMSLRRAGYKIVVIEAQEKSNKIRITYDIRSYECSIRSVAAVLSQSKVFIGTDSIVSNISISVAVPSIVFLEPWQSPIEIGLDCTSAYFIDSIPSDEGIIAIINELEHWHCHKILLHTQERLLTTTFKLNKMQRYFTGLLHGSDNRICNSYLVHDEISLMKNSWSWKITAPLRAIYDLFSSGTTR